MARAIKYEPIQVARMLHEKYWEYYSTVYIGFTEEAVETAVAEHGVFKDLDDLHKYIKENLI